MSSVALPITFRAIGSPTASAPLKALSRTVTHLQADELLVRVSYASINPLDAMIWASKQNLLQVPLPMVLGYDYSGVVVALGTDGPVAGETEAVTVGSAVTGSTFGIGWGGACFAEYVVGKRSRATLRGDVPEADASTYGMAYASAYESLCIATDISTRSGQTIFIPDGAVGVGHFAVQLAKAYGLRVIASASTPQGLELLQRLRADVVLNYSKQDVVTEVLAATDGRGVDLVFDATYQPSSMKQSAAVVAKGGQWVRLGTWMRDLPELKSEVEGTVTDRGGEVVLGDLGRYAQESVSIEQLSKLMDGLRLSRQLYAEGRVKPHISGTVPLEAAALQQALQDSLKGVVGKLVVKVQ